MHSCPATLSRLVDSFFSRHWPSGQSRRRHRHHSLLRHWPPLSSASLYYMGVIELLCNPSSLSIARTKLSFPFEGNSQSRSRKRVVSTVMGSSVLPTSVNESQEKVSGDSFIRTHLRKLKPYQPILPFEVIP